MTKVKTIILKYIIIIPQYTVNKDFNSFYTKQILGNMIISIIFVVRNLNYQKTPIRVNLNKIF